jgi:cysteine synthase B
MRLLDMVGCTPLLLLEKISAQTPGIAIKAKAEFFNPSGSIKDRAAKAMLLDGIQTGRLTKDKVIIDATSGNTGVAYAMMGAALGYSVVLYAPDNVNEERKRIIRSYGARFVGTNPLEGSDGAFLAARQAVLENPEKYFYPDQYNNPANPGAHYATTGLEIWEQSEGKVTHFITSMGTSGTFTGVSRRLKELNPAIVTTAVQPASPFHGIEGVKHMSSTIKPSILDESLIDGVIEITTEEAYEMTRRLAKEEGIYGGVSSGGNVSAALKLAQTLSPGSIVVTMLCDTGSRYCTDAFWEVDV